MDTPGGSVLRGQARALLTEIRAALSLEDASPG
jgi:hypothetical protein